jgi:hypothetical protein
MKTGIYFESEILLPKKILKKVHLSVDETLQSGVISASNEKRHVNSM